MSANGGHPDFGQAGQQLELLCRKVGLRRMDALPSHRVAVAPPPSAMLWSSSYACLLLWPLEASAPAEIERGAGEAEGWFDELLSGVEATKSGPIDGYLVLALPDAPGDDAKDEIRRLELSSRICRKHLIWPATAQNGEEPPELWCRVADVTVLGLPEAVMAGTSELYWPEIDAEAEAVWTDLLEMGAPATAQRDEAA